MSFSPWSTLGRLLGIALVDLLVLPLVALLWSSSSTDIMAGLAHPMFTLALWLSVKTTLVSLALTVLMGTPLAWWLATSRSKVARVVEIVADLPIVIPPAVVGVALLQTFGRQGLLGSWLEAAGLSISFSFVAVVLAQVVVSSPFFVQAAVGAFARVDPDTMIVARSLGATPAAAFFRVALPLALPGLLAGASMSWARALGEFGATLVFAGNMEGTTQTMPLAIFSALESNVQLAVVFSLVLAGVGVLLLVGLRWGPGAWRTMRWRSP